jgi:RNA polymerase sigma-70 factor, ECF subfamily
VSNLAVAFMDARPEPLASVEVDRLGRFLDDTLATARATWPQVSVDGEAWVRALAALSSNPFDPEQPLGAIVVADHYLAFAAANGDTAAIAACDAMLVREAGFAADGTRVNAAMRDEATQVVRERMFVAHGDRPPAIADYAGRGALRSLMRVSVSREIVRLAKAQNRNEPLEDQLLADPGFGDDPALEALKARYRAQMADAFRAALAELPARDRTLLRYQLVDGLTIDEIGSIYKVHRATAARWIAQIRDSLVERTRSRMADALGVDTAEAASIVRLVQSQLDVSVIRHLAPKQRKH